MPDVDDFMELQVVELMRRAKKFVVQRVGAEWKLVVTWSDGGLDDPVVGVPAAAVGAGVQKKKGSL